MTTKPSPPRLRPLVEGFVIVLSILLAFGVDAWWDATMAARSRRDLLRSLHGDLGATRSTLQDAIETADGLLARDQGFLQLAGRPRTIPRDSIEFLIDAAFRYPDFYPALSSYRGAVSTGEIASVMTPPLLEAMRVFERHLVRYDILDERRHELFYGGYLFELTEELGSVYALIGSDERLPSRFELSDAEFYAFVQRPLVYARVENIEILHRNVRAALISMDNALFRAEQEIDSLMER